MPLFKAPSVFTVALLKTGFDSSMAAFKTQSDVLVYTQGCPEQDCRQTGSLAVDHREKSGYPLTVEASAAL